jgi:hypothetical protein
LNGLPGTSQIAPWKTQEEEGMRGAGTTTKTTKGYPRMTAGPLRNQYIHRIVAAALLGRTLTRDEEVHHVNGDRRNCWFTNLWVIGEVDHGWVSAKQHWFMKNRDERLKKEWDQFMAEEADPKLSDRAQHPRRTKYLCIAV